MIDFKSIVRIRKYTLEDGDIFLLDLNSNQIEKLYKDSKEKIDKFLELAIDRMLCDEKGVLLKMPLKDFKEMPRSLVADIATKINMLITGEKKS